MRRERPAAVRYARWTAQIALLGYDFFLAIRAVTSARIPESLRRELRKMWEGELTVADAIGAAGLCVASGISQAAEYLLDHPLLAFAHAVVMACTIWEIFESPPWQRKKRYV